MRNKLFLLITALLTVLSTQAQTVISPNIDFKSERQTHILVTTNSDQFIGKIIAIRNDSIDFKLRNLDNIVSFELSKVKFLGVSGEKQSDYSYFSEEASPQSDKERPMPTNQLFYTASALPYQSNGAYRNTMLLWNQFDLQVGKHFNIGAGSIIPALIAIRAQVKVSLSHMIHAGINLQEYVILFDNQSANHSYAVLTFGDYEKYLNFSYGLWTDRFDFDNFGGSSTDHYPTLGLGGSYDFGSGWRFYVDALVLFNYKTFFRNSTTVIFPSFNFSRQKKRSMFELGLVSVPDSGIPIIPIVSYNFIFK